MNRIKSLDGIRAVSIIMVLLSHLYATMPESFMHNSLLNIFVFSSGQLGVRIFFVISGYLITKLLIIEKEKTGKINLKDFYVRRIFRIFPIFFLYIIVVLILKWFFIPNIFTDYSLIVFASLYLWNYKHLFYSGDETGNGNWFLGHLWSLSMEEQFYLLWPITFIKIKKRILVKIVIVIVCIMPFLRIATYFFMPDSRGQIGMMLHTGGDSILIGCLAAFLEQSGIFKDKLYKYLLNRFFIFLVFLFLFIISPLISFYLKGAYNIVIGISLNNLCIVVLLFWCIYIPSKISWVLNSKIFVQIGILSYSLYIWQQLFLTNRNDFWVNTFPQNIIIVFIVGFLSYYVVEKPILNLKKRFKKIELGKV